MIRATEIPLTAFLTGLRKKGHVIDKSQRDDATCYRLVVAEQP